MQDSEIRKLCEEVEEYCKKATPGPLTYEKRESFRQGSWHYAIKTTYNPPEHPWSPRFVAWMCGSLGEATPSRRNPDDARTDPQIEADCEFFSRARTDLPKLIAALREKIEAERWIPVSEKPQRAGWYNVIRITDGHRSVRCWDDSIEAWMYVGEGPGGSHFVPNNSFTHYRPLPSAPEVQA